MPPLPIPDFVKPFLAVPVVLFIIVALGAVSTAALMVINRNPVRSALFLVLNLFHVAVLYLLLNAYFLAAVQVIVYAGAIMVLFLFVIMLLNLGTPERAVDRLRYQQPVAVAAGIALAVIVSVAVASSVPTPDPGKINARLETGMASAGLPEMRPNGAPMPAAGPEAAAEPGAAGPDSEVAGAAEVAPEITPDDMGSPVNIGRILYDPKKPYLFPFEVTSILLLVAVIGSVVLARRRVAEVNPVRDESDTPFAGEESV